MNGREEGTANFFYQPSHERNLLPNGSNLLVFSISQLCFKRKRRCPHLATRKSLFPASTTIWAPSRATMHSPPPSNSNGLLMFYMVQQESEAPRINKLMRNSVSFTVRFPWTFCWGLSFFSHNIFIRVNTYLYFSTRKFTRCETQKWMPVKRASERGSPIGIFEFGSEFSSNSLGRVAGANYFQEISTVLFLVDIFVSPSPASTSTRTWRLRGRSTRFVTSRGALRLRTISSLTYT